MPNVASLATRQACSADRSTECEFKPPESSALGCRAENRGGLRMGVLGGEIHEAGTIALGEPAPKSTNGAPPGPDCGILLIGGSHDRL